MKLHIMIITITMIVLVTQFPWVETQPWGCCLPTRFEAELFSLEHQVKKFLFVDYDNHMAFEATDRSGNEYTVFDLENGKVFHVDEDGCRFHHSNKVNQYAQCVTADGVEHQLAHLGDHHLLFYQVQDCDVHTYKLLRGPKNGCLPVMMQTIDKTSTQTILYSHVNTTVPKKDIHFDHHHCVKDETNRDYAGWLN